MQAKFLFLFAILLVTQCQSARILAVFPVPSISHQVVFRPLTQALAKRGHEVVVITPDPAFPKGKTPENFTEIDVHDLSYEAWQKTFIKLATRKQHDHIALMSAGFDIMMHIFDQQMQDAEVQKIISENETFDLLLLEACVRPTLALRHKFKAPVIQISSFGAVYGNYDAMGAPTHPILYPLPMRQRIYNLTFWEKVNELYNDYYLNSMFKSHEEVETQVARKHFGEDMPSLNKLYEEVDMLFLNIHPIFEGNQPVPPAVVHLWGLHQKPQKEIPQELKHYLDFSKHGVIYMSFGTNFDPANLPQETLNMFIKVFSQLPYDVLWKWNKDVLPGKSDNIRISKWLPQSDMLRHPKIKLFITQAGLQSTDEAINAGVPLVAIPMLGDQWYNAEKYVHLGIGMKLDVETITEDIFRTAVKTVIEDESYSNNIKKLRTLMHDQPTQALERAVWWTEHVLRHGGARHLRAPAANISWTQYLEIKFFSILLLGILTVVSIVVFVLHYVYSHVLRNNVTNIKYKDN